MGEREKLFPVDEDRLTEIAIILEMIKGMYIVEIEVKLNKIDDLVTELLNKYSKLSESEE